MSNNILKMVSNRLSRDLGGIFPGFFPDIKHNHYKDFGYPTDLVFEQFYAMYSRNGIARAGITKITNKTWQDQPFLLEKVRDGSEGNDKKETSLEAEIRTRFADLRIWQKLAETDRRSLVGTYSGVILRLADNKRLNEAVDSVGGGVMGLIEIIPTWEGQLSVSEWDNDEKSETYGQPKFYQFNEAQSGNRSKQARTAQIHPDRIVVWSRDGTMNGSSLLEPGYNDLLTLEKVSGAGGEGFWKNAKSAPILTADKDARLDQMAKAMGMSVTELTDKMNDQIEDWQGGFDKMLFLQGIETKTLGVTLPSPEHFFNIALQSYAASISVPLKILVGMQTGERASTEDANEFNQTIMSRRTGETIPNILSFVSRLERFRILPEKDWWIDWTDLTESSMAEKIDRASKMAETNSKMSASNEFIFTPEEIRAVVNLEPLSDADKMISEMEDEDEDAATVPKIQE